ncbi:MAG TPA: transglycosylase family protein [Patescibacteria group bacterium]|nr:transglycosylase family protein [Patescibacteria group bacterium]
MKYRLRKIFFKFLRFRRIILPRRVKKVKRASRHPFAVPVFTIASMLVLTVAIVLLSNRHHTPKLHPYVVIISHDNVQQIVPSIQPTIATLLNKLHLKLNTGDTVEPSLNTRINQDKFRINIHRALPVEIIEGNQKTYAFSAAATPRSIAVQSGVVVNPEDLVTSTPSTNFTNGQAIGQVINIKPSVPISLILYGTPIVTRSHSDNVKQLLQEKNIILKKGDTVQPSLDSPVTPNMQVFILRAGTTIVTSTQSIPAPVQTIYDPALSRGSSAVRQKGSTGILLITYSIDPKTKVKTQLQSVQLQAPVPQIIARGTAAVGGSLGNWLLALRTCESGGNYQDNTGNGYYGAYQFSLGTWQRLGLTGYPNNAAPSVQDSAIVQNTNRSSGGLASQNPGCYYKTGISAFPPSS